MKIGQKVKFKISTKVVLTKMGSGLSEDVLDADYFVVAFTPNNLLVLSKEPCDQAIDVNTVRLVPDGVVVSDCAVEIVETKREEFYRILGVQVNDYDKPTFLAAEKTIELVNDVMCRDPGLGMRVLQLGRELAAESAE